MRSFAGPRLSEILRILFRVAVVVGACCVADGCGAVVKGSVSAQGINGGETIVLIRHGEKPADGLGQLTCKGLNRALALPKMLLGRFGQPEAIFAPDPADQVDDDGHLYSYVRPLATIEPTAIAVGLPVNAQRSFQDIADLQSDVTASTYANSTVFIAWEHAYAYQFAQQMLRSYGLDPSVVPPWPGNDYEMIYVFHIAPAKTGAAKGALTFAVQQEGLESTLSNTCPGQ